MSALPHLPEPVTWAMQQAPTMRSSKRVLVALALFTDPETWMVLAPLSVVSEAAGFEHVSLWRHIARLKADGLLARERGPAGLIVRLRP